MLSLLRREEGLRSWHCSSNEGLRRSHRDPARWQVPKHVRTVNFNSATLRAEALVHRRSTSALVAEVIARREGFLHVSLCLS